MLMLPWFSGSCGYCSGFPGFRFEAVLSAECLGPPSRRFLLGHGFPLLSEPGTLSYISGPICPDSADGYSDREERKPESGREADLPVDGAGRVRLRRR